MEHQPEEATLQAAPEPDAEQQAPESGAAADEGGETPSQSEGW